MPSRPRDVLFAAAYLICSSTTHRSAPKEAPTCDAYATSTPVARPGSLRARRIGHSPPHPARELKRIARNTRFSRARRKKGSFTGSRLRAQDAAHTRGGFCFYYEGANFVLGCDRMYGAAGGLRLYMTWAFSLRDGPRRRRFRGTRAPWRRHRAVTDGTRPRVCSR